jgi:hypothetical protein
LRGSVSAAAPRGAELGGGAVGGPWIAVSAFDELFRFEVVLESAFLR